MEVSRTKRVVFGMGERCKIDRDDSQVLCSTIFTLWMLGVGMGRDKWR
jgi:hypothetical protein